MPISETFNQDCVEGMKQYPDKFFDLAIVDPPYGIGDFQKTGDANNFKKKKEKKYKDVTEWNMKIPDEVYFQELKRVSNNQIVWGANYYNCFPESGGAIIWYKENETSERYSNCEIASCTLQKKVSFFKFKWNGFLQEDMKNKEERIHSCQKPIPLYRWILNKYAKTGDKILDTHLGSQSSRIAAYDMGLDFTGFELDKEYFYAGNKRFEDFKKQLKLF